MAAMLPRLEHGPPPSAASRFLVLGGVLALVPGTIHVFLPDGGAGVIAGIDLAGDGARIVSMFAWAGATQIAWGVMMLAIGLAYRPLVPLALALLLVEKTLHALSFWVLKPSDHHPPESYAVLVAVPVIALFLVLALRRRE